MDWDIVFAVSTIILGSCVGVGLANLIGLLFRHIRARHINKLIRADIERRLNQ